MPRPIRLTFSTAAVMQAIAAGRQYGFDIMDVSGLSEGTVYPALRRLEAAGYLSGKWESRRQAHQEGRPARRCYKLTTEGWRALRTARERYPGLVAAFPAPR
jgi:DNA-binding PadR family transcriptional regulator